MIKSIDINCDMGESYGHFHVGQDEALMPYISSCNIACGFHGGDPYTMMKTLELATQYGASVGAHPSYLDLRGFGREAIALSAEKLEADLIYQISALSGMARSFANKVSYVKAHGFLYHQANEKERESTCLIAAIQKLDENLAIMGRAGSLLEDKSAKAGIPFIREAFLDRRYNPDGKLQSRKEEGSVYHSLEPIQEQLQSLVSDQQVIASDQSIIPVQAETLCIHGDHPKAAAIAAMVHETLNLQDIQIRSRFGSKP